MRFIPAVVYLPLLLLVMGARPGVAYILAAIGALWPMLFQTYYGVVGIPQILKDTGRVFGLTAGQRLRHVVMPSVSPFLATGLRIAAAHALVVVVAVEIITTVVGLGRDIAVFSSNGIYPGMYALVGVVGILGLLINWGLESLERRQLHWHSSYREAQ
jgi:ABC-type nitrate/sulfonate/bicarbonate transport system permease component